MCMPTSRHTQPMHTTLHTNQPIEHCSHLDGKVGQEADGVDQVGLEVGVRLLPLLLQVTVWGRQHAPVVEQQLVRHTGGTLFDRHVRDMGVDIRSKPDITLRATHLGHERVCAVLHEHEEADVDRKLAQQRGEDVGAEDAGVGARLAANKES